MVPWISGFGDVRRFIFSGFMGIHRDCWVVNCSNIGMRYGVPYRNSM